MTLPRRLRPNEQQRQQNTQRSQTALNARGAMRGAKRVDRAWLVQPVPPIMQHSFSVVGAVSAASGTHKLYNDTGRDQEIEFVRASLGGGSALTINVERDGAALFSSDITIPGGGTTTAVPDVASDWPVGSYLTVPTGSGGTDLVVTVVSH